MNKKTFFEYYSKVLGGSKFSETYAIYKSLSKDEQKRLSIERTKATKAKLLAENPSYFKDQHKSQIGHRVSDETKKKISKAIKSYYDTAANREKASNAQKKSWKDHPRDKSVFMKQAASLKEAYRSHPEIKQQISSSMKRYYADHPEHHETISEKTRAAMKLFYATEKGQKNLKKWTDGSRLKGSSIAEKEIQSFVRTLDKDAIFNTREVLNGKELDIYSSSKSIAIEYNGNIWHSEAFKKGKALRCHLDKTLLCEEKSIRLIHVFSDEWAYKKDIVKSIVSSAFGVYKKKYMARKLQFKQIDKHQAALFFNSNHIQGNSPAEKYFGLFDDNELIQAVSIGKNRFKKDKSTYELIRMATKLNCQVVGGFSKLVKSSMKAMNIDSIESYIDRRLFDGKGYASSGFEKIGESGPRYFYTDGDKRENRQAYMKQSCLKKWPECTSDMTEHEMCLMHGLYRIYDCGTLKVRYAKK